MMRAMDQVGELAAMLDGMNREIARKGREILCKSVDAIHDRAGGAFGLLRSFAAFSLKESV